MSLPADFIYIYIYCIYIYIYIYIYMYIHKGRGGQASTRTGNLDYTEEGDTEPRKVVDTS